MDRPILWKDLLNSVDNQNLPDPPVFPSDTNVSHANLSAEGSGDLNIWSSGRPSSSRNPRSQRTHEETKVDFGWSPSLTINGGEGPMAEEKQLEATNILLGLRSGEHRFEPNNILSLEDVSLDLNSNQADISHPFLQNPSADDYIKNSEHNAWYAGTSSPAPESGNFFYPNKSDSLGSLQVSSSGGSLNLRGSSSSGIGFLTENCEGTSLDGQRIACKRKSIEEVPTQSPACGSSNCIYQSDNSLVHCVSAQPNANTTLSLSGSSGYLSGINASAEQLNPGIIPTVRLGSSDCHPYSITGNPESSQRNRRVRINPPQHGAAPPSQWPHWNSIQPSDPWSFHQPSALLIPYTQAVDSRVVAAGSSESQPLLLPVTGLVPNLPSLSWNGASSSRTGSSLRSPAIAGQRTGSSTRALAMTAQRSISSREENIPRSTPRNNVPENLVFPPTTDTRNLLQDPPRWEMANGTIGMGHVAPVSRAVTASRVHQVAGATWTLHQNPFSLCQRGSAEVRRSSLSSGSSGSVRGINLPRSAISNTSQEITHQSSATVRGRQQSYVRSAMLMDRHSDGVVGIPLTMRSLTAAREGRIRILSEQIRNAMQFVRTGDTMIPIPLEDILLFDHSVFHGGAGDLHDRHRDLRLDVDNMSYEELLALEERIGNVSTGLSEEIVLKYLKQRKYISLSEEPPKEVEPCCVCQEEYVEGEDVGRLNCGHDFHTACIKHWLMQKNICPICKTTALLDTEEDKRGGTLLHLIRELEIEGSGLKE